MKIKNHLLEAAPGENIVIDLSPNVREAITVTVLVIHYTADENVGIVTDWFKDTTGKVAAHIVLDTSGKIIQMIPFNKRANHAGSSTWDGKNGINYHSIGIEIINTGPVTLTNAGTYKGRRKVYTEAEVMHAKHKLDLNTTGMTFSKHWAKFPQAQLNALYALSKVILQAYPAITTIVGHDDVSPARKLDPGPAFPWNEFHLAVRGVASNIGKMYLVNTEGTNFRNTPQTTSTDAKPLAKGYQVGLVAIQGDWSKVYLANKRTDIMQGEDCIKTIGWIKSSLLTLKPGQ